jgi:hypothetical protein
MRELVGDKLLRQDYESNMRFLQRMAIEWRALFKIGFSKSGQPVGMFIDPDKIGETALFNELITGGIGDTHRLEWRSGAKNVLSYTWKHNIGESGAGDNVRITLVNGNYTFIRSVAKDEKVTDWVFDPKLLRDDFARQGKSIPAQAALLNTIIQAKDFEEVKKYFRPYTSSTAPQGAGYTVNVKTMGNVLFCPPNRVTFGDGFPGRLKQYNRTFYMRKVTHTIDQTGYKCDCEIQDVSPMAVM